MSFNYTLNQQQEVYLILPPTMDKPYRYTRAEIKHFILKHDVNTYKGELHITSDNIDTLQNKYKCMLINLDEARKFYIAPLYRIYPISQIDRLKHDIDNLNEISKYKKHLEQMYNDYIKQNYSDWDYPAIPKY